MPRLNDAGIATLGYCCTWFSPTQTIRYNVPDGDLRLKLFPGNDLSTEGTPLTGPIPVASQYAAVGHWCAEQTAEGGATPGVLLNGALAAPGAALGSYCDPLGPDGSLVVKRVRDSFGPWGFVGGADFGGDCKTVTNYGNGKASWIEGNWIFHTNFPDPHAGIRCYNYRLKGPDFLYQSADTGALVFNTKVIRTTPQNVFYRPDFLWQPATGTWLFVYSDVEGEPTAIAVELTPAQLAALPDVTPPTPDLPVGPVSPPRAADGRLYDMAGFIACDPALASRGGPNQQDNVQVDRPDGIVLYGKFGSAGAYEMYGVDANWMTSLEDASGPTESQRWTDARWFPMHQAIGEAHAFVTGPHEAIWSDRHTCQEIRRSPFDRKMWLHALWDDFYWGPDLGHRPTVMRVYDPTAGIHTKDRIMEVRYEANGAGWCRWEAHRSDVVYQNGPAHFSDASLVQRVDFYRLGGPNVHPILTGCVPPVVPHYPPLPPPGPAVEGDLMSYFVTVDPTKVIVAYATKPSSQTGCLNVLVDAAGTVFSAHGDTRPPGTDGPWEQGQLTGSGIVTFWADGVAHPYGLVLTDKLPK